MSLSSLALRDPEAYREEIVRQHMYFNAQMEIFRLGPTKDLAGFSSLVTELSKVAHCYPQDFAEFPDSVMRLLSVFFRLFRHPDRQLRTLIHSHIVGDIARTWKSIQDKATRRSIRMLAHDTLQDSNEFAARNSLEIIIELYKKRIWNDAKSVDVLSSTIFSPHPKVVVACLQFFLNCEEPENCAEPDGRPAVLLKLQRTQKIVKKSRKRRRLLQKIKDEVRREEKEDQASRAPNWPAIQLINDPQDVTHLLAISAQACHPVVPPESVQPLIRTIANNFVNDRSSDEAVVVGLNAIRTICERCPHAMTSDLLQDLTTYRHGSHHRGVSSASAALLQLFRRIGPGLLPRRERGRGGSSKMPLPYGQTVVCGDGESGVSGASSEDEEMEEMDQEEEEDERKDEDGDDEDDQESASSEEDEVKKSRHVSWDIPALADEKEADGERSEEDESNSDGSDHLARGKRKHSSYEDVRDVDVDAQDIAGPKKKPISQEKRQKTTASGSGGYLGRGRSKKVVARRKPLLMKIKGKRSRRKPEGEKTKSGRKRFMGKKKKRFGYK